MDRRKLWLVASIAALLAAWAGRAAAKDRYYYLGYGVVQVIDGDTDTVTASIKVKGWTREALLSADRKYLYVTASRHLVHKIDLATNKVVATADVSRDGWDRFVFGFVRADDRTAFVAMMSRRTANGEAVVGTPVVAQVELDTGKIVRQVEVPWGVAQLIVVKGGKGVYALGKDLYKIDASGPALKVTETLPMFEKKWNILPLWNYVWENGGMSLVNYYTPEIMGLLQVDEATGAITDLPIAGDPALAYSVTFSRDRKLAYALMDDLTVIDLQARKYVTSVPLKEGTSYGIQVSSDGKKIYAGAGGSSVTVFDAKSLKPLKVIKMSTDGMDLRRVTF